MIGTVFTFLGVSAATICVILEVLHTMLPQRHQTQIITFQQWKNRVTQ